MSACQQCNKQLLVTVQTYLSTVWLYWPYCSSYHIYIISTIFIQMASSHVSYFDNTYKPRWLQQCWLLDNYLPPSSEGQILSSMKSRARKQKRHKSNKQQAEKTQQQCNCYLPRILQERMQTADLFQIVHASRQFCPEICRQFVVYQPTATAQCQSKQS